MKRDNEIKECIEEIEKRITETKLRIIRFEQSKDFFMVKMENDRLSQYLGQKSSLEWVLK